MAVLTIIGSVAIAIIAWPILNLFRNYITARKIGLPIVINPVGLLNPVWLLSQDRLLPLLKSLPFGLGNWAVYCGAGSVFSNRYKLNEKHGPAYLVVTPSDVVLWIGDAEAVEEVFTKRNDFIKPREFGEALEMYGSNVLTLNGEDWSRHRRITTPPFNERNNNSIWKESLAQANGMLQSWTSQRHEGVSQTPNDTMTLALHVLIAGGLGKSYSFSGGVANVAAGHTMSYQDSLKIILHNLLPAILLSSLPISAAFLPIKLQNIKVAVREFKSHMNEMIEEERTRVEKLDSEKDNLLTTLVRASDAMSQGKSRNSLSHDEIMGNLFIYNVAGHDTTANTLCYAIYLLAADPSLQEWIGEELRLVFPGDASVEDWQYEKAFPQLKRCLALMYETLRLYGPVHWTPRTSGTRYLPLKIQGREYTIPPKTFLVASMGSLHTTPKLWGSDSMTFRPDRWISSVDGPNDPSNEQVKPIPLGFVPWAMGPRSCPGKKFSQVEFVAVISLLFRRHRVKPIKEPGETAEEVKKRVTDVIDDSSLKATLSMIHPEKVRLVWEN